MKRFYILLTVAVLGILQAGAQSDSKYFRIDKSLTIYNDVLRQLDINYVDTLPYEQLLETSINAMLKKIDPYTVYMPESQTDDLKFMTTGAYGGIGAIISQRNGKIYIAEPYEGMPAQRHDVRAGDIILEVDGHNVKNESVSSVSALLKGKPHDKITLKLERYGEKKPIVKEFERENIQINPIGYFAEVAPQTGYILLNEFTDRAALEFKLALKKLIDENHITSLIIDLRNNGGGSIDEAIKIVGYFVPKGTEVVNTKGKSVQNIRTYKTTTEPIFPNQPLAIITNNASASASEIVAGAMQDLDRAVLIGERTYGKGLVQNIRPISYNGHLKVTTAKYYIPSGRCIQAIDYSHRNEDGSVGRVPDSLTNVFHTKNGRAVRDGGGITPDITITAQENINITYYLYIQNQHFDFATEYAATHPQIAPANQFEISDEDLQSFADFLTKRNFSYTTETEKYYKELMEIAKFEGLDSIAKNELEALSIKLKPNIAQALIDNKDDVKALLGIEIVRRYYFQKGEIEFKLQEDKELQKAKEILSDSAKLQNLLGKK